MITITTKRVLKKRFAKSGVFFPKTLLFFRKRECDAKERRVYRKSERLLDQSKSGEGLIRGVKIINFLHVTEGDTRHTFKG